MPNERRVIPTAIAAFAACLILAPSHLRAQAPTSGIGATAPSTQDVQAAASAAIPVLTADSAAAAAMAAEYAKMIAETKARIDALKKQIQAIENQIDQLKAELAKLEAALAKLEADKERVLATIKDDKSSVDLMRRVVADRTVASKLLEAMKQRNAAALGELLDRAASPTSIVSVDILSPDAITMIFKVGDRKQCIATRPSCGPTRYSIVK